jgi:hypothetical protein
VTGGLTARAGLPALPTPGTHGYEVRHRDAVARTARLLAGYLCRRSRC